MENTKFDRDLLKMFLKHIKFSLFRFCEVDG